MKKILLSLIYFLTCIFSVQAQTLYGTTFKGGNDGVGALIKFIPGTNNLTAAKSFENYAKFPYYTNFIQASDGKLYGMTRFGGIEDVGGSGYDGGAIFSFDPSSSTYTKLYDFDNTNGTNPMGSLMQARDGKLYGMTYQGGGSGHGAIFSFDLSSSTYTKLHDFDNTNGANPYGSLVQASDGKLYGMTTQGGTGGGSGSIGIIFSFDPSSSSYTKLYDFDGANGANPYGDLMQASDGKLYGMTSAGGSGGYGVIFSFDPSASIYAKLKDLDNTNGGTPYGSLVQANDGKLYGATGFGGRSRSGVIFSFDPSSSTYKKLHDFDYTNGYYPVSLVQAGNGKFYGTTILGGRIGNGFGVVFSFDPSSSTYTNLKDFDNTNGAYPTGSLMQANNGKLYGMTEQGGSSGKGVIFYFDPLSSTFTKQKDFEATNGRNPSASLMRASNGKLYGMTFSGGTNNVGVIFSFDPLSSTHIKLYDFDDTNGANPFGSLVQASNGKLYGMTYSGGSNIYAGVIFSYDLSSSTYTKLLDFDYTNGAAPYGSLVQARDGKLYGMTSGGGSHYLGVIFSFDPSSLTYTKLQDFDYTNGAAPNGSLVQASDGKLYGMASGGGSDAGIIFSFDPSSATFTNLKDFDGTNGSDPTGTLMQAGDGKLYGMTISGGSNQIGVIFSFDPFSSSYTKLKDFDYKNGHAPQGSLMQASDGKLYGMTSDSWTGGNGSIFSFDPSTSAYTKLKEFDGINGANPYIGSAFIEIEGTLPVTLINFTGKNNGDINQLLWKVGNEQDLNYYELQRGIDGKNFAGISQIKAVGNNSYRYNDQIAAPIASVYYYRLKSVDKDGNFKYSGITKINVANATQIAVAPNPFSNSTSISFSLPQQEKVFIRIFDMTGKLIKTLADAQMQPGTHQLVWDAKDEKGNAVNAGIYFLRIHAGNYSETKKLSVN